jgi:RNA polymerase sigma-70 factor (ECF subfamily)
VKKRDRFEELYFHEYPGVVRLAYVMIGDRAAAEDVAQEAFARLYLHWRKVSSYEMPGAWLRRVAIQQASKARRRPRHEQLADDHDVARNDREPDVDLARAVRALPASQRAAIALHYLEGRPVEEVARLMGWAEGTAKTHLHRGRKALAVALGEVTEDVAG